MRYVILRCAQITPNPVCQLELRTGIIRTHPVPSAQQPIPPGSKGEVQYDYRKHRRPQNAATTTATVCANTSTGPFPVSGSA